MSALTAWLAKAPHDPWQRRLLAASFTDALGTGLFLPLSVIYLTRIVGLSPTRVGLGLTIAGVLAIAASPLSGALLGRFEARIDSDVRPMPGLNTGPLRFGPTLSFSGYPSAVPALEGPNYGHAELGLRFPIALVEWGIMAPPIGVDRVFGRVWGQGAQTYGPDGQPNGLYDTVGVELDTDFILLYEGDLELQLGVDHGLDAGGAWTAYASLVPLNFSAGGSGARKAAQR